MKGHRWPPTLAFLVSLCALAAAPGSAALDSQQYSILSRYLVDLQRGRYEAAFALLSPQDQRYFASPANLKSVFTADRVALASYRIIASSAAPPHGRMALVAEHVRFFDQAHQRTGSANVTVVYGIVGGSAPRIKDPYHPWRAVAPVSASAERNGLRITLRKLSFFSGYLEMLASFQNFGTRAVTVLPYGRTVLRDQNGQAYRPLATGLAELTDRTLFTGLRLAADAQYTGLMTFATPSRFLPQRLAFNIAPALADGSDEPFAIELPAVTIPVRINSK